MGFLKRKKRRREVAVDISPLIDVVFILLIFFMVTTTFVKDMKLDLERPSASSAERASSKGLRVYIDRGGSVYMNDAPVKPWMIQSRVRDHVRDGGSDAVLVITDRHVPAEKLIDVVDQCRLAGVNDVGVVTDAEAG